MLLVKVFISFFSSQVCGHCFPQAPAPTGSYRLCAVASGLLLAVCGRVRIDRRCPKVAASLGQGKGVSTGGGGSNFVDALKT